MSDEKITTTKGIMYWIEHPEELEKIFPSHTRWFHSKSVEDEETEDAEFEIIEPKQLPESK